MIVNGYQLTAALTAAKKSLYEHASLYKRGEANYDTDVFEKEVTIVDIQEAIILYNTSVVDVSGVSLSRYIKMRGVLDRAKNASGDPAYNSLLRAAKVQISVLNRVEVDIPISQQAQFYFKGEQSV